MKNSINSTQKNVEDASSTGVRDYRFWPMFVMSFVRTFFYAIFSLALPNYLIYDKNLSSDLVGTIGSISAITYIAGPFCARYVTNYFGIKKTLIISTTLGLIAVTSTIFVSNPYILILIRGIEGFLNGFFWPNTLNLITSWEKNHKSKKEINFLKIFNYSWNFGLMSGFVVGYLYVLFVGSEFYALIFSVIIGYTLIPIAFFLEKSEKFEMYDNRAVIVQNVKLLPAPTKISEDSDKHPYGSDKKQINLMNVPLVMALGGVLFFASSKGLFRFTIPYYFEEIGIESYWVYAVVLIQQTLQIVGLNLIYKFKKMRVGYMMGLGVIFISTLILIFIPLEMWALFIYVPLLILCGLFFGFIQGVAQRITVDKGKHRNSNKYTTLNEVFIGISFGVPPIVAGYLYGIRFNYVFIFLLAELAILASVLVWNHMKFARQEKLEVAKNATKI
ncbi:MFS transporter [Promethearchaeum syntrophicum]|uniref:MFS transporter n=1 Tax=Promethearchaeum syntrophicum TaxID=2594042 RepID=A0A5B9DA42_9ARCH